MRWLICAFVVCIQKSLSRNWVKKLSCKFKYTRTVNERLFRPFFFYLKASNCCGVSGTMSLTLDTHLHLHSLYVSIYAPGKIVRMCRLVWAFAGCMCERRGTIISWTGSFHRQPNVKHDAEESINHFSSWFVRLCVRVMIHRNHLMCKTHNTISWGRRARLISVAFVW